MSHETFNNSQSDGEIREESQRLYGLMERQIPDPMELQMKVQQLQLELSTLKLKKNYYKDKFHQSRDELKHMKAQAKKNQTQVESLEAKLQEQEKNVQTMHHDFLEKAESLIEQNSSIAAQLSQIQCDRHELKKQNTDLNDSLERLEQQVGEAHHEIIKKEELIEKQYREIFRKTELTVELKREICTLQHQVRQTLDEKQLQVKSLEAKMQEQVSTIQRMHRDFHEKEEYFLKENSSIAAEIDKLKTANTNLKKRLQNLEYQERTTESLTLQIFWLEEKVKKQNFKIVHNNDLIDELYEHLKMKREIINNLKDELRREEEEEILAAVYNITGEPLQLENFAPEPEELVSPASEPSPDVVPTQDNLAPEPEELDSPASEPSPDVVPTQDNLAPEPEELDSPVSEPSPDVVPTSGSWRHGAKRLLKIGLGVAAVGLIIPAAYWGFSKLNSDSLFNSVCGLLEPYSYLDDRLVPF
ncbi:golgin subfamily A member 6-like protein 22 isoform X1 [Haplochromis burtoni]|uniref:golgin subfamily A member 6-like protein 22 isoform X1 n=1 Tax=Haplochromis burtoni TaxID=8153 RepID=UPI001C2D508C|nr:golgin subfamily A member 6-like protein 22 isoform X1 [Haplochromis burtoni]